MEYRNLGRTDLKVSELCMGTMQFGWTADESLSLQILSKSYESGINFIDTADIYSTLGSRQPWRCFGNDHRQVAQRQPDPA